MYMKCMHIWLKKKLHGFEKKLYLLRQIGSDPGCALAGAATGAGPGAGAGTGTGAS